MQPSVLLESFFAGSRRALAKVISAVENETPGVAELLHAVYGRVGKAYRLGITGPPGAGKSTIVDELTKLLRRQNFTVGIVAVDPSSPFTGGALLGDRVRMADISVDPGVFIRSMATRGSLGGLSQKAQEAGDVLDAFGKDFVIYETVGVGQSELDIVETADTVIVVLVPESGDAVQAMKAGLMEIADIFVMNKSDRAGAARALHELQTILHLRPPAPWQPPVVAATASEGRGLEEIWQQVTAHREFLERQGQLHVKRRHRREIMIRELVIRRLQQEFWDARAEQLLQDHLRNFHENGLSPYEVVDLLMQNAAARK
ncbi:MAG: methylmalonyl Co-A mutase-associated GTPase MeaB [candidate division KSB1 bacterium]|nr:methylmalonyl Co-A mutase-associated GTPase MeaB [candidate division KSB1 bacterium]MDZ7272899.1 methylmalonyl Co-A mutase-associated GTPase MeaB [candidate division KSB1 bacterium]MDZ7284079.1 methylmalonyl Co-A mutase-associated GTPase MeaB [candidate division KSB1 bacterium]MDZ7297524.1 methylmalonyl Co-A mutase-associated GTPase MeaB [candidate division KSB1 bacterium]MDZ7308260.1 methylmalonyl Co-A mutase-associated GTPase MeaB [candidate division KSB1 bacterium]